MDPNPAPEVIRIGALEIRYLLEGTETSDTLAVFEVTVPPQARVPAPHRHLAFDETICALEGTCTFHVEGRELTLVPGQALFIPRGAVHQFVNHGAETARFLATITPGILRSDYFHELAAIVNAGGPPDPRRIAEIMHRHGLEAVQP